MEILLDHVANENNIEIEELKNFLHSNIDIFHFIEDEMSENIYVNKYDSEDLVHLYKVHCDNRPSTIIEKYLQSFFEEESQDKISDYI